MSNYKQLPQEDVLTLSDVAYFHLSRLRSPEQIDWPVRVVARIDEHDPERLTYSFNKPFAPNKRQNKLSRMETETRLRVRLAIGSELYEVGTSSK